MNSQTNNAVYIYVAPILLFLAFCAISRRNCSKRNLSIRNSQIEAGLTEPASLHPTIDRSRCLGCGCCVNACPEKNVLGLIDGKSELISPSHCIGHGVCQEACPVGGITLVFGTERRGVDIPWVQPNFETNVPDVFIAGELGGMGLIRNAVEQGRQAIESILAKIADREKITGVHDVVIVGVGPAGFSASLAAIEAKLDYITIEQEDFGGTVAHYPRGKIVMTSPMVLPIEGKQRFTEITKEELLPFWNGVAERSGLRVCYGERVDRVERRGEILTVKTQITEHKTQTVLLTTGRRGTPRKLGVPGEEKPKVVYRLIEPEQYAGKHILVVGGGNSALEAATSLAYVDGTKVTISYRGEAFNRAVQKNRDLVEIAEQEGRLSVMLNSNVHRIEDNNVVLTQNQRLLNVRNDAVIICAGGILPTKFLKEIGIEVETKFGVV